MKFTYRWGQRPLDGFTIKRGLGHGGFGEVYFALSDGGKEVALKLIRGQSETELRGIRNCLNLKHPNLVHLYDLKFDAQGDPWLVMEYVQGTTLSQILQRSPSGLSIEQAQEWFLQAARATDYLHDHAVVHRDIKPANLFIEHGVAKLGDYGLSKSFSASAVNQSTHVGTIHYMAPEIANGNYTKQIDVYACGVMLFEMLTGEVPFKGESWMEIAVRHQTELPDLSKVPSMYVPILSKAMSKRAELRYNDLKEMIQAVEKVGAKAGIPANGPPPPTHATALPVLEAIDDDRRTPREIARDERRARRDERDQRHRARDINRITSADDLRRIANADARQMPKLRSWSGRLSELATSMALAPLVAFFTAIGWGLWQRTTDWSILAPCFLVTVALTWAVIVPLKLWEGNRPPSIVRRLIMIGMGALVGVYLYWLEGGAMPKLLRPYAVVTQGEERHFNGMLQMAPEAWAVLKGYMIYLAFNLGIIRWWMNGERHRGERFSLFPLMAAGFWGLTLVFVLGPSQQLPPGHVVFSLIGAAAAIQLVSPWERPPVKRTSFRRRLAANLA